MRGRLRVRVRFWSSLAQFLKLSLSTRKTSRQSRLSSTLLHECRIILKVEREGIKVDREQYLDESVVCFRDWFAQRLCGQPIGFTICGAAAYHDLESALASYSWPLRTQRGLPNPHAGLPHLHPTVPILPANSSFAVNAVVLEIIRDALRTAYASGRPSAHQLSGAVASVFHWGGVYTTRGNRGWLAANHAGLLMVLQAVIHDYARGDDTSTVVGLRFNSGMTKVYSLLIADFIIYDSRVAAALAWLVKQWWTIDQGMAARTLPDLLRFGCLPANGAMANYRNPDATVFKTLAARPSEHYTWNVRANWLLADALRIAGPRSRFSSLREIEAALFQMGNRVL